MEEPIQANARAAALIAAAALGEITLADVPQLVPFQQTYFPNPAHCQLYDDRYGVFLDICRRMHPVYR